MPEGEDVTGKLETLTILRSEIRDPRVLPLSGLWVGAPALQSLLPPETWVQRHFTGPTGKGAIVAEGICLRFAPLQVYSAQ